MPATFEIPKFPSSQLKLVLHYLDLIKVFDVDQVEKLFTDDFVQSTQPRSTKVPSRTKEEDLAFLRGFAEQLEGKPLELTIYDVLEAPGRVWVRVLLHGEFPDGRVFDIESIYQFTLVGHLTSHKIKAINDFVDSAAYAALGGDEGAAIQ